MHNRYCFDSSSLIEAWTRSYPRDVFPAFWKRFETVADGDTVVCPDDLIRELERKDDGLAQWATSRTGLIYPLDGPLQLEVKAILHVFPRFVANGRNKNRGDTFMIGLSRMTGRCVVTEEGASGKPEKPKIGDICQHYDVRWINLLTFIRAGVDVLKGNAYA